MSTPGPGRSTESAPAAEGEGAPAGIPAEFEEYRLVRPLGRGAMGQVFLAHDRMLDRLVAVKFLGAIHPDETSRERFLVEARAIARLQHPNVVAIYRIGEAGGRPYLVSEFIAGQGLEALPRPLPWERAREIALGLARGLAAAHRRGVLHRDIKPANVLLSESGEVKLLDFGLAKLTEGAEDRGGGAPPAGPAASGAGASLAATLPGPGEGGGVLTETGAILGTPLYLAPEIWSGERATPASDVYALGAVIYELSTGQTPHRALRLHDLRHAVLTQDTPPLAEVAPQGVDPAFAAIVDRCLRREPAARFPSGVELCQALEDLAPARIATASSGPGAGPGPGQPGPAPEPPRRSWGTLLPAAGLILAAAGAGIGWALLPESGPATERGGAPAVDLRPWDLAPPPDLMPPPDLAPPLDLASPPDLRPGAGVRRQRSIGPGGPGGPGAPPGASPAAPVRPPVTPPDHDNAPRPDDGEEFIIR